MSIISYKSKDNPITQIPVNVSKINQIIGIKGKNKDVIGQFRQV